MDVGKILTLMYDLSIIIPARNEMFLARTVEDILAHIKGNTEIIVILDGAQANPPLAQNARVTVVYHPVSIGQRAAGNEAAKLAQGKYIMKVDAHCTFDDGFDVKMLEMIKGHDDWTVVPLMKNLHAFDWVCPDGHRRYQGPSGPCQECNQETKMDMVWKAKDSPKSTSYSFNSLPKFQYFNEYSKRPEAQGDISETMSLQGSCFMLTKERYFALNICDESLGSWGSQGIEVAVKTWLSGGKVMVNKKTWYAHLFRTQGGDFSFPYPQKQSQIDHALQSVKKMFFDNNWPLQKYPLSWLLERFWPVPGWTEEELAILKAWPLKNEKDVETNPSSSIIHKKVDMKKTKKPVKGVVYYTHNKKSPEIFLACQEQIKKGIKEKHIISASSLPISFGTNIVHPYKEGWLDLFEKILKGLKASKAEVIFFCEDDVLYHPSHFDFVPPRKDAFYYNVNVWRLRLKDGFCIKTDDCRQLSGMCAYRDVLIAHYEERVKRVREEGFTRANGFEPGTKKIRSGGYDDRDSIAYSSKFPNIDIRHDNNSTESKWRKEDFRNQKYTEGWQEANIKDIPGWDKLPTLSSI